jgi:hypothetical protein
MASPHVQIGISDTLLKRALRELVPTALACQDPQPATADEQERTYSTDFEVTEVVALRADEKLVQDAAGARADIALKTLGAAFNFPTTTTRTVLATPSAGGAVTLADVPRLFLLVSCKFKRFSSAELHDRGTSAARTATGAFEFESDLHRSPQDQAGGALLFAVDALPLASNDVALWFRFLCLFNSGLVSSQVWVDAMRTFSTRIGERTVPLQLGALLTGLGLTSGPINVGVSAPAWTGSPPVGTPPKLALRLGIDAELSVDPGGWSSFLSATPTWLLTSVTATMTDIGVAIDGPYLKGLFEKSVATELGKQTLPAGLSFGAPSVTVGTTLPSGFTGIELRIPVWEQFLGAGDATVSLRLSPRSTPLAGTTIVETFLDATLCVRFDENLGTVALLLLGTILTGGLLFALVSPVIMISGAIIGAVAGIVLARVAGGIGTETTQSQLGTIEPPKEDKRISCGSLNQATGCRTCSIHTDQETLLGRVALAQVVTHPAGVAIVWALPPVAEPALASVGVTTGAWYYRTPTCGQVDPEPVKTIMVRNDGGLPLLVCSVTQYVTVGASVKVLEFSPATRGLGPLAEVEPGRGLAVQVKAHVNDPSYDQASPPPLLVRILTSGGYLELDVNEGFAAEPLSEQGQTMANARSAVLCDALSSAIHQSIWHQVTFTDPIPFHLADRVRERVDVRAAATGGDVIEGRDFAGRVLGHAYAADGVVALSVADSRAGASEHEHSQIGVVASALAHLAPEAAGASGRASATTRRLYRESGQVDLNSPIVGAARLGDQLVVLTAADLRVARALPGGFKRWRALPLQEGTAVACLDGLVAVGSGRGLRLLDPDLEVLDVREGGCRALAATGDAFWCAEADGVRMLTVENGRLTERSLVRLPGVEQLAAGGETVVALSEGHLYLVWGGDAQALGRTAERLTTLAGQPAAADEQGLAVLDQLGRVVASYPGRPWLAGLIEWEHHAVEVRPREGLLVLHDCYETTPDLERLPDVLRASSTD